MFSLVHPLLHHSGSVRRGGGGWTVRVCCLTCAFDFGIWGKKEKQEMSGPRLCSVLTAESAGRRWPPDEKVLRFGEKRQQLRK